MAEEREDKITNRTMAEYSIAKSFKGILRISHIMELIEQESDDFLYPTYFGNPSELMNISGGAYKSREYGYQTAIKAMESGSIQRYDSANPRIANDELKLNRVPMTDSMGNYTNWNIGLHGITIGSNPDINGNDLALTSFYQRENYNEQIVQPKLFPVLKTNKNIIVGLENKLLATDKKGVYDSTTNIESNSIPAMLIIENQYDRTLKNTTPHTFWYKDSKDNIQDVEVRSYDVATLPTGNSYSKLRTIYQNTKAYPEEFDVFMYRQNDYDVSNWAGKQIDIGTENKYNEFIPQYPAETALDAYVDVTNLKDYVKVIINKYMKGNIVEVPSGAVIWQYCSLDKWRAYGDDGRADFSSEAGYPGHRPSLETRVVDNRNPFFNTTIQGACKKQNKLSKSSLSDAGVGTQTETEEESDSLTTDVTMTITDQTGLSDEIIPLYKRDYLLCNGSKYRIPYYPPFKNTNLLGLKEHKDRFFELFFNIGYRYTNRESLCPRPKIKIQTGNGAFEILLLNKNADSEKGVKAGDVIKSDHLDDAQPDTSVYNNIDSLPELPPYDKWDGLGVPQMVAVTDESYDNCTDLDVLFGEDLATMLACDAIYNMVITEKLNNFKTLSKQQIINNLVNMRLPEEYIFNSFIGDDERSVQNCASYTENGVTKQITAQAEDYKVLSVPYYHCTDVDDKGDRIIPIINLGKEVTTFGSWIKFYSNQHRKYIMVKVYQLPMVNYFMDIMTSKSYYDGAVQMFCYCFYNYDFQVPNFMADDNTPVLIGSGAYGEDDDNRWKVKKVQSWTSTFSEADIPHRHGIFWGATGSASFKNVSSYQDIARVSSNIGGGQDPTAAMGYWSGSTHKFSSMNKHGWSYTKTDGSGNYSITDIPVTLQVENGKTFVPTLVMQQTDGGSWLTGNSRGALGGKDNFVVFKDEVENFTEDDGAKMNLYYETYKDYPYSLIHAEDPRFENAEPNRGITSEPKELGSTTVYYHKKSDASSVFMNTSSQNWFTPENITMLPLIKI